MGNNVFRPPFSPGLRCKRDGLGQNQAARYIPGSRPHMGFCFEPVVFFQAVLLWQEEWYIFFSSPHAVSQPLDYCELSNRFPRDQWNSALQFFLKKQEDWWRCTLSPEWIRRSINTTKESSCGLSFLFILGLPLLFCTDLEVCNFGQM